MPTLNADRQASPTPPTAALTGAELYQWLTVEDVAQLLQVSPSWVYEHTRTRKRPDDIRLPYVRFGKYVRFNPRAIAAFLEERQKHAR